MAVHGGNTEEIARKYNFDSREIIDFSANINPVGLNENVKAAMINAIDKVVKYPDITYFDLKNSIGEFEKIDISNITLGNGAAEVIFNIVRALKPQKALLPAPTFSEYEEAIISVNGEIEYYKLKESNDFNLDNEFINRIKENNNKLKTNKNNSQEHESNEIWRYIRRLTTAYAGCLSTHNKVWRTYIRSALCYVWNDKLAH